MSALLLALLVAPNVSTPLDAERAFAADAQRLGQWTAFRKWADPDAVMFNPQAVWARDFLKGRKDPPKSVNWWPASSIMSCDGRSAVNRGQWSDPASATNGVFTTVWQVDKANWRWVYDAAEPQATRVTAGRIARRADIRRASCRGRPTGAPAAPPPALSKQQASSSLTDNGRGQSADRTLGWDWKVQPNGARTFRAYLWNGRRYDIVIDQKVPPQK
jgi:hypothetical protein